MGIKDKIKEQAKVAMAPLTEEQKMAIEQNKATKQEQKAEAKAEKKEEKAEVKAVKKELRRDPYYIVLQVVLKEKLLGTGSRNLTSLEKIINDKAAEGYRLHTISTTSSGSGGFAGGDRIQATMVFEKV